MFLAASPFHSYLWTVTRYVHLNPVRARLTEHPASSTWSSFPGYAHRGQRLEWVAYDELLAPWDGAFGGSDPAGAYRRYVAAGIAEPPESPWKEAYNGWILGSEAFLNRVKAIVGAQPGRERRRESRLVEGTTLPRVIDVLCEYYDIERAELGRRGSGLLARAALAYVARARTAATNAELALILGLSRPESVPNLTRQFRAGLTTDGRVRGDLRSLERALDEIGPSK